MERRSVKSVGASIGFRTNDAGAGSLRLLVAACGDASLFAKVSYPVADMDIRGLGDSSVSEADAGKPRLSDYLADFDAVLKAAGGSKSTALLGYSHAGYFAAAYAIENPGKVGALILVEPALFTPKTELQKRARLADAGKVEEAVGAMLAYVEPDLGASGAASQRKAVTSAVQSGATLAAEWRVRAQNPISARKLASLDIPVLLIGGTKSKQKSSVAKAAAAIPDASVWWIRGAGHLDLLDGAPGRQLVDVVGLHLDQSKGQ